MPETQQNATAAEAKPSNKEVVTMSDNYTKTVLTIMAIALVVLAL
jgi:hypothetical protein